MVMQFFFTIFFQGDAVDKGVKTYEKHKLATPSKRKWETIDKTSDTALWQFLASVTTPAFVVNRVVAIASMFARKSPSAFVVRWIPTLAGLAVIPALPLIIDPLVDAVMDRTTRPLMKRFTAEPEEEKKE